MTTPTPTATAQTLPPSWTPTAPGCLRSTDFWVWMYNTDLASSDARTVLGGPSQTTDCLAPTWTSDAAYAGTQCPPNYTPACSADAVTCCPTVYDFTCVANVQPTGHSEMFRCVSQWSSEGRTATLTLTNFQENKIGQVTRELRSDQHLFALAMVFTTPTSTAATSSDPATVTPPSATSTSTPPSAPSPSNSSLSAGAAAGIGVGATAGVLLIAILCAWLLWWRRRRQPGRGRGQATHEIGPGASPSPFTTPGGSIPPAYFQQRQTAPLSPPSELPSERDPGEVQGKMMTAPTQSPYFRHCRPSELPER